MLVRHFLNGLVLCGAALNIIPFVDAESRIYFPAEGLTPAIISFSSCGGEVFVTSDGPGYDVGVTIETNLPVLEGDFFEEALELTASRQTILLEKLLLDAPSAIGTLEIPDSIYFRVTVKYLQLNNVGSILLSGGSYNFYSTGLDGDRTIIRNDSPGSIQQAEGSSPPSEFSLTSRNDFCNGAFEPTTDTSSGGGFSISAYLPQFLGGVVVLLIAISTIFGKGQQTDDQAEGNAETGAVASNNQDTETGDLSGSYRGTAAEASSGSYRGTAAAVLSGHNGGDEWYPVATPTRTAALDLSELGFEQPARDNNDWEERRKRMGGNDDGLKVVENKCVIS